MKSIHYKVLEEILKTTSCKVLIDRGIQGTPAYFELNRDILAIDYNVFYRQNNKYNDLTLLIILFHEWGHAAEYFAVGDKQDYINFNSTDEGVISAEKYAFEFSLEQAQRFAEKTGSKEILLQLKKNFQERLDQNDRMSNDLLALNQVVMSERYLEIMNGI